MKYDDWYVLLLEKAMACGDNLLGSIYGGEYEDTDFFELVDIINMDVEDVTDAMKGRAIFSTIMAASFKTGNKQKELIEELVGRVSELD